MVDAAYHREWRAKNPEKAREAAVRWRTANREKMLAQKRAYNKRHAVRIRAQQAAWRVANIDSAREYERSQGRKRQVGIGRLGDNLEGVRLAITYLEKQK